MKICLILVTKMKIMEVFVIKIKKIVGKVRIETPKSIT